MNNVVGDNGHGRGVFSIDDRYHQDWLEKHGAGKAGQVPPVKDAANYAAYLLSNYHKRVLEAGVPGWRAWKVAASAYNRGVNGALKGYKEGNADKYTADGNYGSNVVYYLKPKFEKLLDERHTSQKVRRPTIQVDARPIVASHGFHQPVRIVLHDTESYDYAGVADLWQVANFWRSSGYGAHLTIDGDGNTALNINEGEIAWQVAGRNTGSIGIEQIGFGKWTRAEWMKREPQLHKVAKWLAYWSDRFHIPLVANDSFGVTTHARQSAYCHRTGECSSDHTDPGYGYPFGYVLALAKQYKQNGW